MKKIALFLCYAVLFCMPQISNGQWQIFNLGTSGEQSDIQALDAQNIFVAGSAGLSKSEDGGQTWTTLPLLDENNLELLSNLNAIHFFDKNVGIAAANYFLHGIILRTTDGGKHWRIVFALNAELEPYSLEDVYFPTANIGYICGYTGIVLKTTNAGLTWQNVQPPGQKTTFKSIYFLNAIQGFVNGDDGSFKTNDGGTTWTQFSASLVHFPNPQIGYAIGAGGLYTSEDGGSSWKLKATLPKDLPIGDMYFSDANTGYLLGAGKILMTKNGGLLWEQSRLSTGRKFDFHIAPKGWVLGGNKNVWKTENAGGVYTPIAEFSISEGSYCAGTSRQFTNTSGKAAHYTYKWWLDGSLTSSDYHTVITFPKEDHEYKIMLTVSNGLTQDTARQQFKTHVREQFKPGKLQSRQNICAFQNISIQYDSVSNRGVYQLWRNDTLIIPDWRVVSGTSLTSLQRINDKSVTFIIKSTFFDGCFYTYFADTLRVVPIPDISAVQITADKSKLCPGDSTFIRISPTYPDNLYLVGDIRKQGNGGELIFPTGPQYLGSNKYQVIVINSAGNCYSQKEFPLAVNPASAVINVQYTATENQSLQLQDMYPYSAQWDWQFGPKANPPTSSIANPTVKFSEAGYYPFRLIATAEGGCKDTAYSQIDVFRNTSWGDDQIKLSTDREINIPQFAWYNYQRIADVKIDPQGNSYIVGRRSDTLIVYNTISEVGFIQKRNPAGQLLWEQYFIPNYQKEYGNGDIARCLVVEIDPNTGNVWVAGQFKGRSLKMGDITFDNLKWENHFVAKLNSEGKVLWVNLLINESSNVQNGVYGPEVFGPSDLVYAGCDQLYLMEYGQGGVIKRSGGFPNQYWGGDHSLGTGHSWFLRFDESGNIIENNPLGNGSILVQWEFSEQQLPAYRGGPRMKLTPQGNLLFYGIAATKTIMGNFTIEPNVLKGLATPFLAEWDRKLRQWVSVFPVCKVPISDKLGDRSIFSPGFAKDKEGNSIIAFSQPPVSNIYGYSYDVFLPDETPILGEEHSFMFKFSPTGKQIWLNINRTQQIVGLDVLPDGNIIQVSNIKDFAAFQPQGSPPIALPAKGSRDWIITTWGTDGSLKKTQNFGTNNYDQAYLLRPSGCGRYALLHSVNSLLNDSFGVSAKPRLAFLNLGQNCSDTLSRCIVNSNNHLDTEPFSIKLYPNPNSGNFTVQWEGIVFKTGTIQVINALRQVLYTLPISNGVNRLDMQTGDLPMGLYFLQVVSEGSVVAVEKFVKQ